MRPIGSTSVISKTTSPAPEIAKPGRCSMCQSVALPLSELYWHSGGMTTRLASVRSRREIGVKSWLVMAAAIYPGLAPAATAPRLREPQAPRLPSGGMGGAGGADPRVKCPPRGSSGQAAKPPAHYVAKKRAIQVKVISRSLQFQCLAPLGRDAGAPAAAKRAASRLATRAETKGETSPPSWPISLTKRDEMN